MWCKNNTFLKFNIERDVKISKNDSVTLAIHFSYTQYILRNTHFQMCFRNFLKEKKIKNGHHVELSVGEVYSKCNWTISFIYIYKKWFKEK
jgi:hypothetical protein